jgi:hypothetical protein
MSFFGKDVWNMKKTKPFFCAVFFMSLAAGPSWADWWVYSCSQFQHSLGGPARQGPYATQAAAQAIADQANRNNGGGICFTVSGSDTGGGSSGGSGPNSVGQVMQFMQNWTKHEAEEKARKKKEEKKNIAEAKKLQVQVNAGDGVANTMVGPKLQHFDEDDEPQTTHTSYGILPKSVPLGPRETPDTPVPIDPTGWAQITLQNNTKLYMELDIDGENVNSFAMPGGFCTKQVRPGQHLLSAQNKQTGVVFHGPLMMINKGTTPTWSIP